MTIRVMLRNQLVALPEKLRRYVVDGFTAASTKWVTVAGSFRVFIHCLCSPADIASHPSVTESLATKSAIHPRQVFS